MVAIFRAERICCDARKPREPERDRGHCKAGTVQRSGSCPSPGNCREICLCISNLHGTARRVLPCVAERWWMQGSTGACESRAHQRLGKGSRHRHGQMARCKARALIAGRAIGQATSARLRHRDEQGLRERSDLTEEPVTVAAENRQTSHRGSAGPQQRRSAIRRDPYGWKSKPTQVLIGVARKARTFFHGQAVGSMSDTLVVLPLACCPI